MTLNKIDSLSTLFLRGKNNLLTSYCNKDNDKDDTRRSYNSHIPFYAKRPLVSGLLLNIYRSTVSADNKLFADTVSANNELSADTVSANNKLFADTVSANNFYRYNKYTTFAE